MDMGRSPVPLQAALWGVALMVGYLSLRFMSLWDFLGLAALGIQRDHTVSPDGLVTWGIYGETRNPMCSGRSVAPVGERSHPNRSGDKRRLFCVLAHRGGDRRKAASDKVR